MIISRTPFRVSLFGGGTDYPLWFREHGGAVIGTAIDKYCYISVRPLPPFFEYRHRIVYSKVDLANKVDEIQHPAVRGVLSELNVTEGLEIHHDADLPSRSGLGSSSAFTVGLLHAIYAFNGRMVAKRELAKMATHIEQEVLKEKVGCQDQLWAAFGNFNRFNFLPDGSVEVTPIILSPERRDELQSSLMLFFTGFSRFASDFADSQIKNIPRRKIQLSALQKMVDNASTLLASERSPIRELGEMLHESWLLKRELADTVSNSRIDDIYEAAREAGAIGGKLLGAGGGGFMILVVKPDRHEQVRERLKDLVNVKIGFDQEGSKIVLYQPNGL